MRTVCGTAGAYVSPFILFLRVCDEVGGVAVKDEIYKRMAEENHTIYYYYETENRVFFFK